MGYAQVCVWVCAGMRGCVLVCASVRRCAKVYIHVCGWMQVGVSGWVQYARVCIGACGSAQVSASVCVR